MAAGVRAEWRAFTWRSPDWWLGAACLLAWMGLTMMFLAMYAAARTAGTRCTRPAGAARRLGGGAGGMSTAALLGRGR